MPHPTYKPFFLVIINATTNGAQKTLITYKSISRLVHIHISSTFIAIRGMHWCTNEKIVFSRRNVRSLLKSQKEIIQRLSSFKMWNCSSVTFSKDDKVANWIGRSLSFSKILLEILSVAGYELKNPCFSWVENRK